MPTTTDDSRRILELLAGGKITVDEADQLLRAVSAASAEPAAKSAPADDGTRRAQARWVRITVDKAARDGRPPKQVTIRVPMSLVRGGVKLGAMFPQIGPVARHLRDQGIDIDFSKLDFSQIESVLSDLGETTVDVDDGRARVKITCE